MKWKRIMHEKHCNKDNEINPNGYKNLKIKMKRFGKVKRPPKSIHKTWLVLMQSNKCLMCCHMDPFCLSNYKSFGWFKEKHPKWE